MALSVLHTALITFTRNSKLKLFDALSAFSNNKNELVPNKKYECISFLSNIAGKKKHLFLFSIATYRQNIDKRFDKCLAQIRISHTVLA